MAKVCIGLGSNKGNKRGNLITAAALLAERAGDVLALSTLYETEPWGFVSENTFLNAALLLDTALFPPALLDLTLCIETEMGRTEKTGSGYQDRLIDIDILLYNDLVLQTDRLVIPHPLMHCRLFVLEPLAEIVPHTLHPVLHKTVGELCVESCKDDINCK
ncbi:Bifunctional folate synthesis protein [Bacteroidales bacterium Barb7]|nr:Bifunctional folate synthesis protein [Bacteroidales bacterium Barb7]